MNDMINEKEFLEGIKSEITDTYKLHSSLMEKIDKIFDLITERVEYKKALIRKFEESVDEYEYEPEIATNEEIKRVEQFGEVVKEIIGI